ncbi:MAG: PTS sugar transporter subunit IIA [Butyricicoccus sp.]
MCIAQLKHSVEFEHMGDPDTKVQAEMLFMMAIKNPDEQVELLQEVLGVFQQPEVVAAFRAAKMKTSCSRRLRSTLVDYRTAVLFKTVKFNLLEG